MSRFARSILSEIAQAFHVPSGVTFCGDSKSSDGLTLQNVPWHEEVVHFVAQLAALLPEYEIASEHEHSNCVLVAHSKVSYRCLSSFYLHRFSLQSLLFHLGPVKLIFLKENKQETGCHQRSVKIITTSKHRQALSVLIKNLF